MANDRETKAVNSRKRSNKLPSIDKNTLSPRTVRLQNRRDRRPQSVDILPEKHESVSGTQNRSLKEMPEKPAVQHQLPNECKELLPNVNAQPLNKRSTRISPSVDVQQLQLKHERLSPSITLQPPEIECGSMSPSVYSVPLKEIWEKSLPTDDNQPPKHENERLLPNINDQSPNKVQKLSVSPPGQSPKKSNSLSLTGCKRKVAAMDDTMNECEPASNGVAEEVTSVWDGEEEAVSAEEAEEACALSAAQRARMERNRLRARALQDARLVQRPPPSAGGVAHAVNSGGGFLLESEEAGAGAGAGEAARGAAAAHAPVVAPELQPRCLHCERRFPQSYLYDTFNYSVCDQCRDDEGEHALITRTEAKNEFFLKDCDLDLRPPPLASLRRRNPHRLSHSDMRLYLLPQVRARALQVWGSEAALRAERGRRELARERGRRRHTARRLRALRMDVRSSLYDRAAPAHAHDFAPERRLHDDLYERACRTCPHVETYEKM